MATLDARNLIDDHALASEISNRWATWKSNRQTRENLWKEVRNYLFATDTTKTSDKDNPWFNKTHTPKLRQIADNLQAGYMAHIFPKEQWVEWIGYAEEDETKEKRDAIQSYFLSKARQSDLVTVVEELLEDWHSRYGECYATINYEHNLVNNGVEEITGYVGPRLQRISPYDIVFNPTASSWDTTPKIVRSIKSLGAIKQMVDREPENAYMGEVFDKMIWARGEVAEQGEPLKADAYIADGFSSLTSYYESGNVELLQFYGDIYDKESGEFLTNRHITVVDRAWVIDNKPIPNWLGKAPILRSVWRTRPDNLHGMSAVENIVGLQHRLDTLENTKADVFDQIAYPARVHKGFVEDYDWEPGVEITIGEDADIQYLHPDATALQADFQIDKLEQRMEELAGAPRESMGIRTEGEKTAVEVQTLTNAQNRIFENKADYFQRTFLEPMATAFLESARRNMKEAETLRDVDANSGVPIFSTITKEDVTAVGRIVPIGARFSKERSRRIQNIQLAMQSRADPTIKVHQPGSVIAEILAEEIGEPRLYEYLAGVKEEKDLKAAMVDSEVDFEEEQALFSGEEPVNGPSLDEEPEVEAREG